MSHMEFMPNFNIIEKFNAFKVVCNVPLSVKLEDARLNQAEIYNMVVSICNKCGVLTMKAENMPLFDLKGPSNLITMFIL